MSVSVGFSSRCDCKYVVLTRWRPWKRSVIDYLLFMNRTQTNKLETFRNVSNWRISLSQSLLKLTHTKITNMSILVAFSRSISFAGRLLSFLLFLSCFCVSRASQKCLFKGVHRAIDVWSTPWLGCWPKWGPLQECGPPRQKRRGEVTETRHGTVTTAAG